MFLPFVLRSATLAGLSIIALLHITPAYGRCRNEQDHHDPRYRALQQAVDDYLAQHHQQDVSSGINLHVSLSPAEPSIDVASGSTSLKDGKPSVGIAVPQTTWLSSSRLMAPLLKSISPLSTNECLAFSNPKAWPIRLPGSSIKAPFKNNFFKNSPKIACQAPKPPNPSNYKEIHLAF